MNRIVLAGTALIISNPAFSSSVLSSLDQLKCKHRVILIDETNGQESSTLTLLQQQSLPIDERDIVWVVFGENQIHSNYSGNIDSTLLDSARMYGLGEDKVLLIGKDGGVKNRLDQASLQRLFVQIDGMPMRRAEMEKQ